MTGDHDTELEETRSDLNGGERRLPMNLLGTCRESPSPSLRRKGSQRIFAR